VSLVDRLVDDSSERRRLYESAAFQERLTPADVAEAAGQVTARPDASSYHTLLALRRDAPETYAEIPAATRAAVLADALRTQPELNDFGWLDEHAHFDGPAAQALLALGDAARGPLAALLDDDAPAELGGSESAMLSRDYGYRRRDWAYHYLARILGREPAFPRDPAARDREIAALQASVE
jgi:hypothetical protein